MKITGSIGRKALSFFSCLIFAMPADGQSLTETTNLQPGDTQIKTICSNNKGYLRCDIYRTGKRGEKKLFDYPAAPAGISLVKGVFVILFPCGTQCSATYFYSQDKGLAGPFPLVEAYDLEFGMALSISVNPLPIYQIYPSRKNPVIRYIRLDLPRELADVPGAIRDVRLENHSFIITYVDRHGVVVTLSYPVPRANSTD
ncbi:hypothetical protein AB4Z48_33960 [Cupriavidus sp. 2TAF22]|uniref:hypothetical protein n=1 Tax=unclassified Cupriavidus TaxID=2640874 RepID=UPI003F9098D9